MRQIVTTVLVIAAIVSLVVVGFTYEQVQKEKNRLESDLQYRSTLLAETLKESIEIYVSNPDNKTYVQGMVDRFNEKKRVEGVTVYDNKEMPIASSSGMDKISLQTANEVAINSMDEDKITSNYIQTPEKSLFFFAQPLREKDSVVGSLVLVQNASFINDRLQSLWYSNLIRLTIQVTVISAALILILNYLIYRPLRAITESVREASLGGSINNKPIKNAGFLTPLFSEIQKVSQSLQIAQESASLEARLRHEKEESPWTESRLKEYIKNVLHEKKIIAVSNREPYEHTRVNGKISVVVPASGMVTALEPVMQACGGTWVANGSGLADQETADEHSRIPVPPDNPKYTLRRIWLTREQNVGYYQHFSNEGLWPLCHLVHTRPIFRPNDWRHYREVNEIFSKTVLEETNGERRPIVLIQDFHLALTPNIIKSQLSGAKIGIFWHIPWPNAEVFSICPYRKELIDGMLGADLIGFHTQQHCNNFIDTVNRELESLVDIETGTITRKGHKTRIRPFPISISFTGTPSALQTDPIDRVDILKSYGIHSQYVALGVDRLDYTKGLIERIKSVDQFLTIYPQYQESFTLLQISSPSRTDVKKYQEFTTEVKQKVEEVNKKYAKGSWKPIVFVYRHHSHEELTRLYKIADVCMVTSLHDGMNLVAKEFISARDDEGGSLILSKFAGAAKQLEECCIINPYDIEETAHAIHKSLTASQYKKQHIMHKLREKIQKYNIYRWSYEYLKEIYTIT